MNSSLRKDTFLLMFSSVVFMVSGYLTNIWLGRFMGPYEYGNYGIVITFVSIINIIQYSGIPNAVSKYISTNQENKDAVLNSGLVIQLILSLIITVTVFLGASLFSQLLNDPTLESYIKVSAFIFPLYGIYAVFYGYYNGLHQFKTQGNLNNVYAVTKVFTVLGFAYFYKITGALIGFILAPLIAILIFGRLYFNFNKIFSYKKIILFSLPLVGYSLLNIVQQSIDIFFVKSLTNVPSHAGYYTAYQNIARLPFYVFSTVAVVLFPIISKNKSLKMDESSKEIINKATRLVLMFLLPTTLIISATSTEVINILYSSAYSELAQTLSILIIGFAFFTLYSIFSNIINGLGSPTKSLLISTVGVITTIILCPIFIPMIGLNGAAISTSIGSFIAMIISGYVVYRHFNTLINLSSLIRIFCASLLIYIFAKSIIVPVFILPFFYVFLFSIYVLILAIIKELTKDDVQIALSLIPTKYIQKIRKK